MQTKFPKLRSLAFGLLMGVAAAGFAAPPDAPSGELLEKIEAAKTPADHEALATYYMTEAANAHAMAERHQKMATAYQGNIAGGRGAQGMKSHCNKLVKDYQGIAAEYEAMATAHRQMAQHAKP